MTTNFCSTAAAPAGTKGFFNQEFYYKVPQTKNGWTKIIKETERYAPHEELPGYKYLGRIVIKVSTLILKNKKGETQNPARATNASRDNKGSFEKGINVKCLPPKVLRRNKNKNLFGGFGRKEYFDELGYKYWIYDEYEDNGQETEFAKDEEDKFNDNALSDNGEFTNSPPTKQDYVCAAMDKISKYGWDKAKLKSWFDDGIKHTLTDKQVEDYVADALRRDAAKGRIEWFREAEIKQQVKEQNLDGITVINTNGAEKGNDARFLKVLAKLMDAYVESNGMTQEIGVHNTFTSTWEATDMANDAMAKFAESFIGKIERFAAAYNFFKTTPWKVSKRMTQRKGEGGDEELGVFVDYPEKKVTKPLSEDDIVDFTPIADSLQVEELYTEQGS